MSKQVVHNPQEVIGALLRICPRGPTDGRAIFNAVACINHLQNVIQRQRKTLATINAKGTP